MLRAFFLTSLVLATSIVVLPCRAESPKLTSDELALARELKVDTEVFQIIKDYLHVSATRPAIYENGKRPVRLRLDMLAEDRANAIDIGKRFPELKPLVDRRLAEVPVRDEKSTCQSFNVYWPIKRAQYPFDSAMEKKLNQLGFELLGGQRWQPARAFTTKKQAEEYLTANDTPICARTMSEQKPAQKEVIYPIDWTRKDYSIADKAIIVRQSWPELALSKDPQQHFEAVNIFRQREFGVDHPERRQALELSGGMIYWGDWLSGFELSMPDGAIVRRANLDHWRFEIPARFSAHAVPRVARLRRLSDRSCNARSTSSP